MGELGQTEGQPTSVWQKYKWVVVGLIVLFLGVSYVIGTQSELATNQTVSPSGQATTPGGTSANTAIKTVDSTGGVELAKKESGHCTALAPADWEVTSKKEGDAMDLNTPDKSMYAGWAILGVDRAMQPFYGDLYGDPETSIKTLAAAVMKSLGDESSVNYTSEPQTVDVFSVRSFASDNKKGDVIYRIYPTDGDNYVESMYFSVVNKGAREADEKMVGGVATSIRCTTQLRPPPASSVSGSSSSSSRRSDGADGLSDSGYNAQLGTEYAHDPNTGENYLVSPSTSYNETGPQGPGYYKQNGNDTTRLESGRSD